MLVNTIAAEYKFEGLFPEKDGEKRLYLVSLFLPYNPSITAYVTQPIETICAYWWPKGVLHCKNDLSLIEDCRCDFLWIDTETLELQILQKNAKALKDISIIYTTTHFKENTSLYKDLVCFLRKHQFHLLSHWYWEGEKGNAIFIRKDIFDVAMKSFNFTPSGLQPYSPPQHYDIDRFMKRLENKTLGHGLEGIDYIYMINLDERPEKFAQTVKEFEPFGINPYRFSAVNGWKLPREVLCHVGVKFLPGQDREKFMASIYQEEEGHEYLSNEFIQSNGKAHFTLGMSRGAIGIVLSHLSVLKDAYDSGYHTIWVMEDDAEPIEDPRTIPSFIQKLDMLVNDWDILFTDTDTKDTQGRHVPCRALCARPNFTIEPLAFFLSHFYQVSPDFSRVGMRYGAYSMIIRRSGMKKILDHFCSYGVYLPYDMDFWLIPDLKMYCINRDIVSHRAQALSDNNKPRYEARDIE